MPNRRPHKSDSFEDDVEEAASMIALQPTHTIRQLIHLTGFRDKGIHDNYLKEYIELSLPSQTLSVQQQAVKQVEHYRLHGEWAQAILLLDASPPCQHATPTPADLESLEVDMPDFNTPDNEFMFDLPDRSEDSYISPRSLGDDDMDNESGWTDIDSLPNDQRMPYLALNFGNCATGYHHGSVNGDLENLHLSHEKGPLTNIYPLDPLAPSIHCELAGSRKEGLTSGLPLTPRSTFSFGRSSSNVSVEDYMGIDVLHYGDSGTPPPQEQVKSAMLTPCLRSDISSPGSQLLTELNVARLEGSSTLNTSHRTSVEGDSTPGIDHPLLEMRHDSNDNGSEQDSGRCETEPDEELEPRSRNAFHPRSESSATEAVGTEVGGNPSPGSISLEQDEALRAKSKDTSSGVVGGACAISTPTPQSESPASITSVIGQDQSSQRRAASIIPSIESHRQSPPSQRNYGTEYITPMPDVDDDLPKDQSTNSQRSSSNNTDRRLRTPSVSSLSSELRNLLAEEQANGIRNSNHLFSYSPTPPLADDMSVDDTDENPTPSRPAEPRAGIPRPAPDKRDSVPAAAPANMTGTRVPASKPTKDVIVISDDSDSDFNKEDCIIPASRKRKRPSTATKFNDKPRTFRPGELSSGNRWQHPLEAMAEDLTLGLTRTTITLASMSDYLEQLHAKIDGQSGTIAALQGKIAALEQR